MMQSITSAASLTRSTSAPIAIALGDTIPTDVPSSPATPSTSSSVSTSSSSSSSSSSSRSPRHRGSGNKASAPVTIPSKSGSRRPDPIAIARTRPLSTAAPPPTSPASATRRGRANSANNMGASLLPTAAAAGPSPASAGSFTFGVPNSPAASPASGMGMGTSPYLEPASPMTVAGYQAMSPSPSPHSSHHQHAQQWGHQPSTRTPPSTPGPPLTPRSTALQDSLPTYPSGLQQAGSLGSSPTFSMGALQAMEPPSPAPPMDHGEPESPYPAGAAAIVAAAAKALLLNNNGSATSPPMSPTTSFSSRLASVDTPPLLSLSASSSGSAVHATGSGVVLQSFSPLSDGKIGSPVVGGSSSSSGTAGEKIMYIVRGISGSGKSTLSRSLLTAAAAQGQAGVVISTDDFFMTPKGYRFDPSNLDKAHRTSHNKTLDAIRKGLSPIIIDNTHTQRWEAKFYVTHAVTNGYTVRVAEPDTVWKRDAEELAKRNTHKVPLATIQRMLARWEEDFSVAAILASEAPKRGPNTATSSGSGRASAKHSPITGVSPGVSPSITPAGTPAASPQLGASSRSRLRVPGGGAGSSVFVDSPSTSPQASPRHHGGGNLFGAPAPMPAAAASSSRANRSSAPAVLESNRTRAPLSNPFAALDDEDDDQASDDDANNGNSDNDD